MLSTLSVTLALDAMRLIPSHKSRSHGGCRRLPRFRHSVALFGCTLFHWRQYIHLTSKSFSIVKVELAPNSLATKQRRRRRPLQHATRRATFEAFSVFPDCPLMTPLSASLSLARDRSRHDHRPSLAPPVITWLAMSSEFIVDTICWFCFCLNHH